MDAREHELALQQYKKHQALMTVYRGDALCESDEKILRNYHQFVRDDEYDEKHRDDWKIRMARKYYDKLYREYCICDLSRYLEENMIGMRWRTEKEVILGKGQFICAEKRCNSRDNLHSYEVPFRYAENGVNKLELVKLRVCLECARKLFYHKLRDISRSEKRKRKLEKHNKDLEKEREELEVKKRSKNNRKETREEQREQSEDDSQSNSQYAQRSHSAQVVDASDSFMSHEAIEVIIKQEKDSGERVDNDSANVKESNKDGFLDLLL